MFPPTASDAEEDARFRALFQAKTGAGPVTFAQFMALALYAPEIGYYRRPRPRIGLGPDRDFYTATSAGTVFGELVAAACVRLLAPEDPARFTFVEFGAEPDGGALTGVAHPFRAVRCLGPADERALAGDCIVFSNELFDAQPFHRLVRHRGTWREMGVTLNDDGFVETELPALSAPVAEAAHRLPPSAPEGYRLDLPLAATALAAAIARADWRGLFLAFDYGKTWTALAEDTPTGTARAYRAHRQVRDLFATPGRQDLTCHICWDWMEAELTAAGFAATRLESQESFLLRHAASTAEAIAAAGGRGPDPRRSRLHELLHPGLLGQRFQALHAARR